MTLSSATAQESLPMSSEDCQRVYWHRELPPVDAEIMGEHVLEATSERVQGSLTHRDELWDRCYCDLLDNTHERFDQEIRRLGGDYAHVLDESIDSRHDPVTGEVWLHGLIDPVGFVMSRRMLKTIERLAEAAPWKPTFVSDESHRRLDQTREAA